MEARNEEAAALLGLGARQKTMVEDKKKVSSFYYDCQSSMNIIVWVAWEPKLLLILLL